MYIPTHQPTHKPPQPKSHNWLVSSHVDLARLVVLLAAVVCEPEGIPCSVPDKSGEKKPDPSLLSFAEHLLFSTSLHPSSVYCGLWFMFKLAALRQSNIVDVGTRWAAHGVLGKIKARTDAACTMISLVMILGNKIQDDQ